MGERKEGRKNTGKMHMCILSQDNVYTLGRYIKMTEISLQSGTHESLHVSGVAPLRICKHSQGIFANQSFT